MNFSRCTLASMLTMVVAGTLGSTTADAGCPCQRGGETAMTGAALLPIPMQASDFAPQSSVPVGMPYSTPSLPGVSMGQMPAGTPSATGIHGPGPGYSAATATTWQPPPGTIGQTYQIKSRPVPVKMHPRAAIVDVRIPNARNVRVHDMNIYRTQDFLEGFQDDQEPSVWHFTSEPLIPGIPHIYRIEARVTDENGEEKVDERYVRLIMGRVIEVTF